MVKYDILIPAYNVQNTISELLNQIKHIKDQPEKIIIVDDGSTDDTPNLIREYADIVITNNKNYGKGLSLRKGFDFFLHNTGSDYLLCLDADLQHPVSHIPLFLSHASVQNSEFIIGKRERRIGVMPFPRIISNFTTSIILSLICNQKIDDSQCGFRLISRNALRKLELREDGFQLESEMIVEASRAGIKIEFISIPTIYNGYISHINHMGDTLRFIHLILSQLGNKK